MDKLKFLTAGIPILAEKQGYKGAFETLKNLKLDGLEAEFVHGVRISEENIDLIKNAVNDNFTVTCHGPYYINLNAKEQEKIDASVDRILDTARVAKLMNAYSITYHAAFYMGNDKDIVFQNVVKQTEKIVSVLKEEDNNIFIRPETTGKGTQWGTYEEIIKLSELFDNVLPCIDFAHIHARSGGQYNTYDEFCKIFDLIGTKLGDYALKNFHAHIAGIEYSPKGEKRHLILEESDMNYKDLLKAFKNFDIKGVIVCESPNIETDAKILKEYYLSL
ncbi:TIM barrel protein [bacterium]|nr:TIM barrel protein [bacterium]